MGYLDKDTSNGSVWVGVTLQPMQKFKDNFQIVSTDYENYAIVYTCTFMTTMYNNDDIVVLLEILMSLRKFKTKLDKNSTEFLGKESKSLKVKKISLKIFRFLLVKINLKM